MALKGARKTNNPSINCLVSFSHFLRAICAISCVHSRHNLRYAVEYGSRMLMMHQGQVILDKSGEEKQALSVNSLLSLFNEISIECGN